MDFKVTGDHQDAHLVETLASHLDPVHLQHLVVHCQEPCRLGQPSRNQPAING